MCICICAKYARVFAWMQKLFWPVNLDPLLLPVISSGVQLLEREGELCFPPHWGCQSSPLVSCRHNGSQQTPKWGDGGRHRTYNNNSGNKFEKWGTHWPIGITPSLTLTMLSRGEGCVSVGMRERERQTKSIWDKEGKASEKRERGQCLLPMESKKRIPVFFPFLFYPTTFPKRPEIPNRIRHESQADLFAMMNEKTESQPQYALW